MATLADSGQQMFPHRWDFPHSLAGADALPAWFQHMAVMIGGSSAIICSEIFSISHPDRPMLLWLGLTHF